jgi:surface protein
MTLIIHTLGTQTRIFNISRETSFAVVDRNNRTTGDSASASIDLPEKNSPYTLTGIATNPRFAGRIALLAGDFGAVFQGSFEEMFKNCFLGNIRGNGGTVGINTNTTKNMFKNTQSEDWSFVTNFDVSSVADFSFMFAGAVTFNQPLNHWNVSSAITLSGMFGGALAFNQPLNSWDVSNATSLSGMFVGATAFNQPLDHWNVMSATDLSSMFRNATVFNQPLVDWDVSSATDLSSMFEDAETFNQPLDGWDVSSATDLCHMFSGASAFNQPLNHWNVSSVTDLTGMFGGAVAFNQSLASWNVSSATDFSYVFYGASAFNQPLAAWDVSSATDFSSMFAGASAFNQPLAAWDVSSATDFSSMFAGASAFNQPLQPWDIANAIELDGMFEGAASFQPDRLKDESFAFEYFNNPGELRIDETLNPEEVFDLIANESVPAHALLADLDTVLLIVVPPIGPRSAFLFALKDLIKMATNTQNYFYPCRGLNSFPLANAPTYVKIALSTNFYVLLSNVQKVLRPTQRSRIFYLVPVLNPGTTTQKAFEFSCSWDACRRPDPRHIGRAHCQTGSKIAISKFEECRAVDASACLQSLAARRPVA